MFRRTFLPSVADLLAFEAAARHTSISRAAEEPADQSPETDPREDEEAELTDIKPLEQ